MIGAVSWYSCQLARLNNMPVMGSNPQMNRLPVAQEMAIQLFGN